MALSQSRNASEKGLLSKFCQLYLPRYDAEVVLEDESGDEYTTNYLKEKALSGGWRSRLSLIEFKVIKNYKLMKGKPVYEANKCPSPKKYRKKRKKSRSILKLVDFSRTPVYIVRAKYFEVANALNLPNSVACEKETGFGSFAEKNSERCEKEEKKRPRYRELHIIVNGITIDLLATHVRTKYYNLYCNQISNIHKGLINSNMATGIISETINIADAIRASQISISRMTLRCGTRFWKPLGFWE
ncbi:B3 domain-containing protein Os01g0234100-like [Rhododendron vialii]|uniref:B3 domain-containing protein Os01g0234100-like n=1 Tax=Rhododendron vialii TaxID=182163 RepID=UPI00265FB097|nr:B3 domain-containing protein Os01g0234100-like [Rhododendron vialii]